MKTEGYKVKSYSQPVKRYCQTLSLRDNPELIEAYRKAHSKEESWPEIRAGIREVGILEMEIYILGSKLFMIVETIRSAMKESDLPAMEALADVIANA